MKYDVEDGEEYGIIDPSKNWFRSLVLHIPFLRRLYSRKVIIHIVSRSDFGTPLCEMSNSLRVFKWTKKVHFKFKVGRCTFTNVMMYMTDRHDRPVSDHKNFQHFDYCKGKSFKNCETGTEYDEELAFNE